MAENKHRSERNLSDWLQNLSQESWQLELLISGFVLFLLLAGLEPYHDLEARIQQVSNQSFFFSLLEVPYHIFRIAYYLLLAGLLSHVVFRGLWISCLGLRSVSGEIDYDTLRLQDRFRAYLERRMGTFDRFIERLENICSILFAIVFLLVFSLFSLLMFALTLITLQLGIKYLISGNLYGANTTVDQWITLAFLVFGLIYLVDFTTLGWLKRKKWASKWYYPIWRFYGFITAAGLYRPIYYNLIDNRFGRIVGWSIAPVLVLTAILVSLTFVGDPYIPFSSRNSATYWYRSDAYEDSGAEIEKQYPSVATAFPREGYLPVFVPYIPNSHDRTIVELCPDLEEGRYFGLKVRGVFQAGKMENERADPDSLLQCMKMLWRFRLNDSLLNDQETALRFYHHPKRDQHGLRGVVPVYDLPPGEHQLQIDRYRFNGDSMVWYPGMEFYFFTH